MTGLTMTYASLIDAAARVTRPRFVGPSATPSGDCFASVPVADAHARIIALLTLAESELHTALAAVAAQLREATECVRAFDAECEQALT